jgi:hypothetical protein
MKSRLRKFKVSLAVGLLVAATGGAGAFSLLGPGEPWQTPAIGYNPVGTDVGNPLNLGEAYRFNRSQITYGFDQSFSFYFGSAGTAAVHAAFAILNALPPVSQMSSNLTEFPTDTKRVNYQASALNLVDLKTAVLGAVVEHMGLASSERWVWALRDRRTVTVGGSTFTNYVVIQRNFDPITFAPSPYVNGVFYGYQIEEYQNPAFADARELQVDPLAIGFSAVSGLYGGLFDGLIVPGEFFTGLTRDDVGGLRYLLRPNRVVTEFLANGAVTNGITNVVFDPLAPAGQITVVTNTAVSSAPRPGVDKLNFILYPGDAPIGPRPVYTNTYTDVYYTNVLIGGVSYWVPQTQTVVVSNTQPDIIFTAEDLGVDAGGSPILFRRSLLTAWQNNSVANSVATLAGPGVIQAPLGGSIELTFSKLGPYFFNSNPFFIQSTNRTGVGVVWGSFDGSANPPVVFPDGASIQELEYRVLNP